MLDKNSENPEDARRGSFTYGEYRSMLRVFRERGYEFALFNDTAELVSIGRPFVLLRHDLDMSLNKAVRLAEIDAAEGARSTFFIMLRSDHYNPLSETDTPRIKRILELGHALGLHFDAAVYPELKECLDPRYFRKFCRKEIDILGRWFGAAVQAVSFHRPSPIILAGSPELTAPLPHAYMELFTKQVKYYSDSTGRWRFGHPLDSPEFAQGLPLQILTHPIWWNETPISPQRAIEDFIDERTRALKQSVAANCTAYKIAREGGDNANA